MTASAATRNTTPYTARMSSSSTVSTKTTSAAGGTSASSGLPARNARAWQENTAAHTAAIDANTSGFNGGAGATWMRACSPTGARRPRIARRVSRVGRPYHVVAGKTMRPSDDGEPAASASVASSRLRRSSAHAISADRDAHEPQRRAVTGEHASERERDGDRDGQTASEGGQALDASRCSLGECHRSSNLMDGGEDDAVPPGADQGQARLRGAALQLCAAAGRRVSGSTG